MAARTRPTDGRAGRGRAPRGRARCRHDGWPRGQRRRGRGWRWRRRGAVSRRRRHGSPVRVVRRFASRPVPLRGSSAWPARRRETCRRGLRHRPPRPGRRRPGELATQDVRRGQTVEGHRAPWAGRRLGLDRQPGVREHVVRTAPRHGRPQDRARRLERRGTVSRASGERRAFGDVGESLRGLGPPGDAVHQRRRRRPAAEAARRWCSSKARSQRSSRSVCPA